MGEVTAGVALLDEAMVSVGGVTRSTGSPFSGAHRYDLAWIS
jgi:hypothetical protein